MITIEPMGGLCNRLRTLDAALALGKSLDRKVQVIWYQHAGLNCRFDELFEKMPGISRLYQIPVKLGVWRLRNFSHRYFARSWDYYANPEDIWKAICEGYDFNNLKNYRKIYIASWSRFYSPPIFFQGFRPVAALQKTIDDHQNVSEMIGVHIRRTDHEKAIQESPTEKFLALMQQEISENPSTNFFLATDDPFEEARLRDVFPGRIYTYPKEKVERNSPRGIKDALVDLYCLASCRKLIGCHASAFSMTAWQLSGIPHVMVREQNETHSMPNN